MGLRTTAEAARRLRIHQTRVQFLIREGRLSAQMIGKTYVIGEADLSLVAERPTGRPKKADEAETVEASRKSALVKSAKKRTVKGCK